jgi:hypothetical protein
MSQTLKQQVVRKYDAGSWQDLLCLTLVHGLGQHRLGDYITTIESLFPKMGSDQLRIIVENHFPDKMRQAAIGFYLARRRKLRHGSVDSAEVFMGWLASRFLGANYGHLIISELGKSLKEDPSDTVAFEVLLAASDDIRYRGKIGKYLLNKMPQLRQKFEDGGLVLRRMRKLSPPMKLDPQKCGEKVIAPDDETPQERRKRLTRERQERKNQRHEDSGQAGLDRFEKKVAFIVGTLVLSAGAVMGILALLKKYSPKTYQRLLDTLEWIKRRFGWKPGKDDDRVKIELAKAITKWPADEKRKLFAIARKVRG